MTESLIEHIIRRSRGYDNIYTIWSSKGGTDAIYYGLKFNVTAVYSGSCQYYVGDYLNHPWHNHHLSCMVGKRKKQDVIFELNSMMPEIIKQSRGTKTNINLLYYPEEHTYPEHIVHLIKELDDNMILHNDYIEHFQIRSDIAVFFPEFLRKVFDNK